jgi:arginine-tRNA-protein transferase
MSGDWTSFVEFLYAGPLPALECRYLLGDELVGVSVLDECPGGLSSVYMYFDPAHARRSLGTYSVLWEIEHCRRLGKRWYYLGYHVEGSRTMDYKARFRPQQVLVDGCWRLEKRGTGPS